MLPPKWMWKVKYSSGSKLDLPTALDGEIHLWIMDGKSWIVLMHATGIPIVGKFPDLEEVVCPGSQVKFPNFLASVVACSSSP